MTPKRIDWDAIEPAWREGVISKNTLAKAHGISRPAMDKHFKNLGIERDLSAAIDAKTKALLNKALVTPPVATADYIATHTKEIEIGATVKAGVILTHRKDISKLQKVVSGMIDEITTASMSPTDLASVAELVAMSTGQMDDSEVSPAQVQKRIDAFNKLLGISGRADVVLKLMNSYKTLVGMERQAFGLSDNANGEADTIKAPEVSANEAARRVAFVLMQQINVQKDVV